jgi:IS30 family transposase
MGQRNTLRQQRWLKDRVCMSTRTWRLQPNEVSELWRRFKAGETLRDISRALVRNEVCVWKNVAAAGGFAPSVQKRRKGTLTLAEREEISRGLVREESLRCIARRLARPASTISREVARNGGRARYRAERADREAPKRARRPKPCKLAMNGRLRRVVANWLKRDWSPEQISNGLKLRFPHEPQMRVSTETIYRSLFIQARGVLKKELTTHLRSQRTRRHAKKDTGKQLGACQIPDPVSIRERPPEVEDRAVPGHWEGDLIVGSDFSYVATLVERSSRYVMLAKLPSKETAVVVAALKKQITKLPAELRRSLTWDRGLEMSHHKQFSFETEVDVYFCDPASPWQRGTNENTNGLLRQYLPENVDLRTFTQAELNAFARRLNQRPRKTLGFQTPAAIFEALLH